MRALFAVGSLSLFIFFVKKVAAEHWSYDSLDSWSPLCQNGTEQSPINIDKNSTIPTSFSQVVYRNYENADLVLQNTGHTVELRMTRGTEEWNFPYISGGPFGSDYYIFDNFHFHWNSEHMINGSSYPLEGHFLHFNTKLTNISNAITYFHGFTVLAVMYTVEDTCGNSSFEDIASKIDNISSVVDASIELTNTVNIYSLFPADKSKYFVYNGSFTTPDCDEGALWVVFEEPACVLRSQLQKLSGIYTWENRSLSYNNRPVQDLHTRKVLYSSASDTAKKKCLVFYVLLYYIIFNYH